MDIKEIEYIANIAFENSKLKEENNFLQEQISHYKTNSLVYIMEQKCRNALIEIKDRIPEDYKIYQWYDDVMNIIKEVGVK